LVKAQNANLVRPGRPGRYGCAYVGFDDGFPQGGLNTKGVAYDWVAGYMGKWPPNPGMKKASGNPTERGKASRFAMLLVLRR
jgi:hypothetical protein